MATNAKRPDFLLDTSVAVAFVVSDHAHHKLVFNALKDRRLGLAGHAAFETFSVLTRLPSPARPTPAAAVKLMTANFPETVFLSPKVAADLLASLPTFGIAGGSIYDALVAATAKEHAITLATRDQRAERTYQTLDIKYELIT